jgi:hypothetical protein
MVRREVGTRGGIAIAGAPGSEAHLQACPGGRDEKARRSETEELPATIDELGGGHAKHRPQAVPRAVSAPESVEGLSCWAVQGVLHAAVTRSAKAAREVRDAGREPGPRVVRRIAAPVLAVRGDPNSTRRRSFYRLQSASEGTEVPIKKAEDSLPAGEPIEQSLDDVASIVSTDARDVSVRGGTRTIAMLPNSHTEHGVILGAWGNGCSCARCHACGSCSAPGWWS